MIDTSIGMKNNPWMSYGAQAPQLNQTKSSAGIQSQQTPMMFPQQARQQVINWGSYDPTLAEDKGQPELLRQYPFLMRWLQGQNQGGSSGNQISFGMNF